MDQNDYYGGNWTAFNFNSLREWAEKFKTNERTESQNGQTCSCYSNVTYTVHSPSPADVSINSTSENKEPKTSIGPTIAESNIEVDLRQLSRKFALELSPKLLFCRGSLVDLLMSSRVGKYLECKLLESVFVDFGNGDIEKVPTSKEDVFSNKKLSLVEKRKLMKFFTSAMKDSETELGDTNSMTFSQLLDQYGMTGKYRSIFVNGVAMLPIKEPTNYSAQEGLRLSKKYLSSLGRFGNSPLLCPLYGGGCELAQSFCRVSAVYGGICMLNQQITALSRDPQTENWVLKTEDGEIVNSKNLVMSLDYSQSLPTPLQPQTISTRYVSRAIIITDKSLYEDCSVTVTIIPPNDSVTYATRVIQMSEGVGVVPSGYYVLCFSVNSDDGKDPKADLFEAVTSLVDTTDARNVTAQNVDDLSNPTSSSNKPQALFSLFYTHTIRSSSDAGQSDESTPNLIVTPDPDDLIDFGSVVDNVRGKWDGVFGGGDGEKDEGKEFLEKLPDPEEAWSGIGDVAEEEG